MQGHAYVMRARELDQKIVLVVRCETCQDLMIATPDEMSLAELFLFVSKHEQVAF